MKAFLKKEFKLAMPAGMYVWAVLGILSIIPNYPAVVGYIYTIVGVFVYLVNVRDNRDLEFCAVLPVSRKTIVAGKCIVVCIFQQITTCFAVIGSVFANFFISPNGNLVGIDPNVAFFGIIYIALAVYNVILLPNYFKTGYKLAKPVVCASIAFVLCFLAFELPIQLILPLKNIFDTLNTAYLGYHVIILAVGLVLYTVSLLIAIKLSIKNFEKVNL